MSTYTRPREAIIARVYFRDGLRAEPLQEILKTVGFTDFIVGDLKDVLIAQTVDARLVDRLRHFYRQSHYFILSATKAA